MSSIDSYYDRTELVKKTIATVERNLIEGGILVVAVLLLLLGNIRGGLIVASAIPLSMLFAFTGMVQAGLSGNLMSLGAIDFGLIVDGSVVMIENIVRRLGETTPVRRLARRDHSRSGARSGAPNLLRRADHHHRLPADPDAAGCRGQDVPADGAHSGVRVDRLVDSGAHADAGAGGACCSAERSASENPAIMQWLKAPYQPMLERSLAHPGLTAGISAAVFVLSLGLVPFMGSEFIPKLDEGAIALQAWRLPSVSLTESVKSTTMIEKTLKRFPEVVTVVSRTGVAEIPTDPMGLETSDIYVILKSPEEWTTARNKEGLIAAFNEALEGEVPGNVFSYSQPIELRVQELIAGVRSDVAVTTVRRGSRRVAAHRRGHRSCRRRRTRGGRCQAGADRWAPAICALKIRRDEIARYGINASQVLDVVQTIGGREVGEVLEGQRRFTLQARFTSADRHDLERIRNLKVADPQGRMIPLSQLADIIVEEGPAQISRENIHRRIAVEANVRGRDLGGFIADVQRAISAQVKLPTGYYIEYGGQFENLQRASKRLTLVLPVALFLIFVLLFITFNAVKPAILIYFNIPIAATGGVVALFLRGMPFSISAGVGFIALFGVAVMNGLVLLAHIDELRRTGLTLHEATIRGSMEKMRAMIMAPLVAGLGFVPMALSTGAGAEVQRPLATVVIGGLVTSTALTLLVLPALYRWFEREKPEVVL